MQVGAEEGAAALGADDRVIAEAAVRLAGPQNLVIAGATLRNHVAAATQEVVAGVAIQQVVLPAAAERQAGIASVDGVVPVAPRELFGGGPALQAVGPSASGQLLEVDPVGGHQGVGEPAADHGANVDQGVDPLAAAHALRACQPQADADAPAACS